MESLSEISNNEVFLIDIIVHDIEVENLKQKETKLQFQMFNLKLQTIKTFEIEDLYC